MVATDPGTRAASRAMMTEAEFIARRLGASFRVDLERRQVDFVLVDVLRRSRARGRSGLPRPPRKRPRRTRRG